MTGGQKKSKISFELPTFIKKISITHDHPTIGLWSWTDREWTWLTYLEPKKFMIVSERGSYFKQVNMSDHGSRKMWTFPSLDSFSYSRSSLMETMFDFRSVRLRGSIRDITKHFPLNFFHELGQTASKSKFKPLPENKYIFASMFSFNILKAKYFSLSKNWSFWQRLDESLNFCCWVVNKPTIFRESIFW